MINCKAQVKDLKSGINSSVLVEKSMTAAGENINILVLKILSPILILIGVAGYALPSVLENYVCIDNYYNLFHIDAGIVGVIIFLIGNASLARSFNITLGCLYVYQSVASFLHIFPAKIFHYTIANDIINVDLGAALILVGILANNVMEANDKKQS